jgi:hypothetical protein
MEQQSRPVCLGVPFYCKVINDYPRLQSRDVRLMPEADSG